MKRVLIFGAHSYIGERLEQWLTHRSDDYTVETMESRNFAPEKVSFSGYDVLFFVAGIVHQKETKENRRLYYQVNRNLACKVAVKAKREGVRQFLLMSTMSVYGRTEGRISADTREAPTTHYGKSKLQADDYIRKLSDDTFHVAILRPPMVYGRNCKGNYQLLRRVALKSPIFPKIKNRRSMIYVENLCAYIEKTMDSESAGLFLPQNDEYVCTSEMVQLIAEANGRRILLMPGFGWVFRGRHIPGLFRKIFGDLTYARVGIYAPFETDENDICTFRESVYRSEMAGNQE